MKLSLLPLALVWTCPAALAQGTRVQFPFNPIVNPGGQVLHSPRFPSFAGYLRVKTGDIESDNDPDVVAIGNNPIGLRDIDIFVQGTPGAGGAPTPGFGDFSIRQTIPGPSGSGVLQPFDAALADFDNDGDLDLVEVRIKFNATLPPNGAAFGIHRNDLPATNSFTNVTASWPVLPAFPVGTQLGFVAAADMDLDGDMDMVVTEVFDNLLANPPLTQVHLLRNTTTAGVPSFTRQTIYTFGTQFTNASDLAVGNLDGNALPDVVLSTTGLALGALSQVLLTQATGGAFNVLLQPPPAALSGNVRGSSLDLADVNGDGDGDPVFTFESSGAPAGTDRLYVLQNGGGGNYVWAAVPGTDTYSFDVNYIDADQDGQIDLASIGTIPAGVGLRMHLQMLSVFVNVSPGSASPRVASPLSGSLADVQPADIDMDGDVDVLGAYPVASGLAENVTAWINHIRQSDAPATVGLNTTWNMEASARTQMPADPVFQSAVDVLVTPYVFLGTAANRTLTPYGWSAIGTNWSSFGTVQVPPSPGFQAYSLQIPNAPSLIGLKLFSQAIFIRSYVVPDGAPPSYEIRTGPVTATLIQ